MLPVKTLFCLACSVLLLTCSASGAADTKEPQATEPDDLRTYLELLRSDFNSTKIATFNEVMKLTATEADKFWPIYREYEKELGEIAARKLSLIREFASLHQAGQLDEQRADKLAKSWLDIVQDRLSLWKNYYRKVSRALSPVRGAQFLQVEHQMALFIDLGVASEMPVIKKSTSP
jgi:hypothetical protein